MQIHPTHNTREDDDEIIYCVLCSAQGRELIEECPDRDPVLDRLEFSDIDTYGEYEDDDGE